jgi:molybdopterin-guanine dinucleotide biosynthesis protein A
MIAAVILAGGAATRLGGAIKSHLVIDGRRVIDRQLDVLRTLTTDLAIAANDAAPYREHGLPILPDRVAGLGPAAGILAALAWSPHERVVSVGGDMPFLDARVLTALVACDGDAVAPRVGGRAEPLCAVYARACAPVIERRLAAGQRSVHGLLAAVDTTWIEEAALRTIDPTLRFLVNVNTSADLKNATASVHSSSSDDDRGR